MRIAISSPNIDGKTNVSGIVSVVRLIMQDGDNQYFHFLIGKPDKSLSLFGRVWSLISQFFTLKSFLIRHRIDIYHQNYPYDRKGVIREFIISFIASRAKIPILLHVHGGGYFKNPSLSMNCLARYSFRKAKAVIVLSEMEKRYIDSTFGINSVVLANAVDTDVYLPNREDDNGSMVRLLFLGRIEANKGVVELIESMQLNSNNISLTVCGEGPLREDMVRRCAEILGDKFQYKGVVCGEEKIRIIQDHDLFLLPSYFEGLPIALLETMSCGVVPIASSVGSIPSVVKDGFNGLLLKKNNGFSISEAICRFSLLSKDKKQMMKENAYSTIIDRFDKISYLCRLNNLYKMILTK